MRTARVAVRTSEDWECLGRLQRGCSPSRRGKRLDRSVAEPAIVVGEIAGGGGGLEVLCVGQVEESFVDSGVLELVDVTAEKGEGDGSGDIDASVFELAFDVEGDGDEAAGGGFGEVAGPLVDADGADDLLGFSYLVHLGPGGGARQKQGGEEDAMGDVSHRPVIEIRR